MTRIAFVACSKTKGNLRAPAAALYVSPLFRKSLLAALRLAKRTYILSAKYGVLALDDVMDPYDRTLKNMSVAERGTWGETTGAQLAEVLRRGDTASLYAGEEYIAPLRETITKLGCRIDLPLGGLSLGQ